jgi:hypothetical protein
MLSTRAESHNAHAEDYDAGYDSPFWRIYNEITWNYIRPCLPKSKKKSLFRKNRLNPIKSVGKPVWATPEDYLKDKEVYERVLKFEFRFSSLPSVAGVGNHIAILGREKQLLRDL